MKTVNIMNLSDNVINEGLTNGEEFLIDGRYFEGQTFKCLDCFPDSTGEVPCSSPSCECAFYNDLETCTMNFFCPMTRLINEHGKMVVGLFQGQIINSNY